MTFVRSAIMGLALVLATCGSDRKYEAKDCSTIQTSCSTGSSHDPSTGYTGCASSLCHDYTLADACRALFNCGDLPESTGPVYECNQHMQRPSDLVMECLYDAQGTAACQPGVLQECEEQEE